MSPTSREVDLLVAAAGITDGAEDMDGALRRLAALLVPDFADAAWIDVLDPGGGLRRVAACVQGPDRELLERWLLARGAVERAEHSPTTRALRGEGSQLAELDAPLREAMTHDPEDGAMIARSGLRSTMAIPLQHGDDLLGALGVGVGASGRRYGREELEFAELLAGRAALALANAQLLRELTATERRLDGILGTLAEAVIVHDAHGRVVFANPAAAALLGARDVGELLRAEPAELAGRFDVRDPHGRVVYPEELPGARVIRGERPEPLLTRTVARETGEARWLLTKATPLRDATGATLAVNVIEDQTEERSAFEQLRDVAQTLQSSLLPDALPRIPGWECAAHYRPGQHGTLVGGDFYDVFPVGGGHVVLLGDVTGKGIAAAALTALVRHTARTAARFDACPAHVLAVVDGALTERPVRAPVTMLCGLLRDDGTLLLASGGHPLPLLKRAGGAAEEVGRTGLLLGAVDGVHQRPEVTVPVAPGDTLLLYTDGVTETLGADERFGDERLLAAASAAPDGTGPLLAAVVAELDGFAAGSALDDRAMLALRRLPP